ncbi:MAG: hypothetical protein KGH63_01300, partial [Candidatus Micrarchaeota archaeon]|nr:hypothetical protein [Candidatus Micrarchaeota archaeon]
MASVCIICHQEKSGAAVADTTVIRTIRAVKEKLRMAANNTLVVCADCRETHAERRKRYESKWITHLLIGLALIVLAIGLPLVTGAGFNIFNTLFIVLLAGLVAALALLDYMPPLARTPGEVAPVTSVPSPPAVPAPAPVSSWMGGAKAPARPAAAA